MKNLYSRRLQGGGARANGGSAANSAHCAANGQRGKIGEGWPATARRRPTATSCSPRLASARRCELSDWLDSVGVDSLRGS